MNELEMEVMRMLLAGDHPVLAVLRQQLEVATVREREFTGVGFFTYFDVPDSAPRVPDVDWLAIGDVYAELEGLQHTAGFVLFLGQGVIDTLECFGVEETFPENPTIRRAFYMHPRTPGNPFLCEIKDRDLGWVFLSPRRRLKQMKRAALLRRIARVVAALRGRLNRL
jgi:hypothetical protein